MSRMELANRTAVVTGAGSGIGRALALSLAQRGCHLALGDIDAAGLARTMELLDEQGTHDVRISTRVLDVADVDAVAAFPEAVLTTHPTVDLLINNAGVALGGTFAQLSADEFDWLFDINFHGVVHMTRAFLPLLQASDDARIVNLSSVFGMIAPPGQTAYVASKFAVRGFSESLRHELAGTQVGVTVVHPGGVATAIAERARHAVAITTEEATRQRSSARKLLRLSPNIAGETIIKGIERRRDRVLVGSDAHAIAMLVRLLPVSYWKIIARFT